MPGTRLIPVNSLLLVARLNIIIIMITIRYPIEVELKIQLKS